MVTRVLVLGAGCGGLELATVLSAQLGADARVTLLDDSEAFVFGYSKLDLMFGRRTGAAVRLPYAGFAKPGVEVRRERIVAIDPAGRTVTTDAGTHEAEALVVALGADYDFGATPGLLEGGDEFYSVAGAERAAAKIPAFSSGRAVIGVCGHPFKCPPAPSEAALLLDENLRRRGVRDACEIVLVMPVAVPVPPSPEASEALLAVFAERDVRFVPSRQPDSIDPQRRVVVLNDGQEVGFDLFLGVPRHKAPDVVVASGLTDDDGYVPVDPATLRTRHEGVYAIGDVAKVGVPKAGIFAEGQGRVLGELLAAEALGEGAPAGYDGLGSCFIEFGAGQVGRVDVDFFSGPVPTGAFQDPSAALVAEKDEFGAHRSSRWFGA
ncbi:MAG: FAD/NAD(P)-binding oxidoreductase [Solirubrobacterales bacterium]